ncbi:MAG: SdiA-regulated domain-containing protein [Prolixibacteraceae bacterium]|nr:SdiA-regulated domain-containing protein [Prolixibacteraceae bacterium]
MLIFNTLIGLLLIQPVNAQVNSGEIPYNFNQPAKIIALPEVLKEISGIVMIDDENMACIEDENGKIYIYNLKSRKIETSNMFGYKGDYEGIAYNGNEFFIARNDGVLFEVSSVQSGMEAENFYSLPVPCADIESITFNKLKNCLLFASKGTSENEVCINQSKRTIYSFNLKSKSFEENPFVEIPFEEINAFLKKNNIVLPPVFNSKGEIIKEQIKLRASDMAIHPLTSDIYILSASEHLLFVFSTKGALLDIVVLNEVFYPQAEGITFTSNGDIYISNEGGNGSPTLLFIKKIE